MIEQDTIKHHIGRSIVEYLHMHEYGRFSELRPKEVDSNLFTYHLKLLIQSGHIKKTEQGYTLDHKGLMYVDRVSGGVMKLRQQPKIITMLLIQDGDGRVLLQKRKKQPYINTWSLPHGKLHMSDESVLSAGMREAQEKLGLTPATIRHVGDCYVIARQTINKAMHQSRTFAHILRFETDDIDAGEAVAWIEPLKLRSLTVAPAVEEIITRAFFGDDFFFEEFYVDLQ